ncbi:hypothetical protein SDC9_165441 [bioreactor metagenome]|uniref:Uncharacterized protein n=1 Tax=bioreactor metagenome TaxID=1076179 RepID=A0A645G1K9_9ZZZZ
MLRQQLAQRAVAIFVVNGTDQNITFLRVIMQREQTHVAYQVRAQELADKALVLVIAHGVVQSRQPGRTGHVGKPAAIFIGRLFADPPNITVHGKAQRIRIDAAEGPVAGGRLVDHIGMR